MLRAVKIEIWTDVICPWCGIGEHRLQQALERFEHAGEVDVVHRSFQLDERAPTGSTESVRTMLQTKKGMSAAQVDSVIGRVQQIAADDGLSPYIVADNQVGNTALAHELAAWAAEQGRDAEIWARLYRAYFGEAASIFDVDSLVALAEDVGLDPEGARAALTSRKYATKVVEDGREARALGASGVPFIVVDRRYGIKGAQPTDAILEVLEQAWKASRPIAVSGEGESCGPEGCDVPAGAE